MTNKNLSIVIPCFNEEETIMDTYKVLRKLINNWDNLIEDYQIVIVNNGSTDHTLQQALSLRKNDKKIKIIDLRNNYGYQSSITAGLLNADYDMIVSIDADLQDDPSKIEEMINLHYEGYDMILGVRSNRKSDNFLKRISANIFYKLMRFLGTDIISNHGDFRLLSKDLVKELSKYGETNRFLRAMIMKLDNKYKTVTYERTKREKGVSKFGLSNLLSLSFDAVTSFSARPIRLIFLIGLLISTFSFISILIVIILYFFVDYVDGWASIAVLVLFFSGIQLISIGIIGEYISKTYLESKSRPLYHIRKIYK